MSTKYISVQSSVLALIRGDLTVSCVADRFGVTEAEVREWQDTFLVAGILALNTLMHSGPRVDDDDGGGISDPTTTQPPMY